MRDLLVLAFVLFWLFALTAVLINLARLVRNMVAQLRVHAGMLAGADPAAVKTEAEHVQEWLDLYNAEPDGTPKKQALKARLAARGMTFD